MTHPVTVPDELPHENLTGVEPTSTLNGGSDGLAPILAVRLQTVLSGLRQQIEDLQEASALGWQSIASGEANDSFTVDITDGGRFPAGTFAAIHLLMRGSTEVDGTRINLRINNDDTPGMHYRSWSVRRLDTDTVIQSGADEVTTWPIAYWSSGPACISETTIFNTDTTGWPSCMSRSYRASSGVANRHQLISNGHLTESRLVNSLRIFAFSGTFNVVRWWVTGLRSV